MCCPYFSPLRPAGAAPTALPLGDRWNGMCCAAGQTPSTPEEPTQARLCNMGYARGECVRFPAGDGPDAVRFAVARDDGESIGIRFALERDHHPYAHGSLEYRRTPRAFASPPEGDLLRGQARAYTESYLRRIE
jgi:hypothetical protein